MNDTTPLPTTPAADGEPPRRGFSPRPILVGLGSGLAVLALGVGGFALADTLRDATDDRIVITSSPSASPSATPTPSPSNGDDDCVVVSSDTSSVIAGDDCVVVSDQATYNLVIQTALNAVGGGTVTEVDQGDSPGDAAWKVEIRLANGDEAEVRLDANLNVIRVELDNDHNSGSDDSGSDDHGGDDNGGDDNSGHGSDDSGSGSDDD